MSKKDKHTILAVDDAEKFAVCMPNVSIDHAMRACDKFRDGVQNHKITIDHVIREQLSVSIGVAVNVFENETSKVSIDELLKLAYQALYYAKDNGRNATVNSEELLLEELPMIF